MQSRRGQTGALLAACFTGGCAAAFMNSLAAWLLGLWGITAFLDVAIAPNFSPQWLYPRLVWGGLWGLLFFFSVAHRHARRGWIRKGLILSLVPTLVQLFMIFPSTAGAGVAGLGLGTLTPLVVLFLNLVWGFFAGVFTRMFWGR